MSDDGNSDGWVENDPEEDKRQREAAAKLNKWSEDQAAKKNGDGTRK